MIADIAVIAGIAGIGKQNFLTPFGMTNYCENPRQIGMSCVSLLDLGMHREGVGEGIAIIAGIGKLGN